MSDYKTLNELSAEQIGALKQSYLCNVKYEDQGVSWGMLANADNTVSMEELEKEYGHVSFTDDDFFCSASN